MLRFPLAVFVVFIHVEGYYFRFEAIGKATFYLTHFISNIICKVAVPEFFSMSGFLFFLNVNQLDRNVYGRKLINRSKTILVPYIIWNSIAFLIFILAGHFGKGCFVTKFSLSNNVLKDIVMIYGYTFDWGWKNAFGWTINHYTPIDAPLWFLRDLMLIFTITPFIHMVIKRYRFIPLIIFFWLLVIFQYPTLSALFYFSLGACFSILHKDPLMFYENNKIALWSSLAVLVIPSFLNGTIKYFLLPPFVFVMLGSTQYLPVFFADILKKLSKYSFCIYCTHMIISLPIVSVLLRHLNLHPAAYYFLCGFGSIVFSMLIYHILKPISKWIRIV